jgi:putative ABC transport system permease protein
VSRAAPASGSGLGLAWRLAGRELRGGIAGFRVFLASLTLGVAAIAAVATVNEAVSTALQADARVLLGGDLDVRLVQRAPSALESAHLAASAARTSTVIEMRAMARATGGDGPPALVELKAVDAAYPLVGRVETEPPMPLADLLAERDGGFGAIADQALLTRLGLAVGDRIGVGDATFVLRATLVREPDRIASVAAFGPRLMIAEAALAGTGLMQPGALFRHATRIALPAGTTAAAWSDATRAAFPEAGWQIRGLAEASPGVDRFVDRLALFLGFAGMTALLIGGLGVANAVRTYLDGKAATIATLKCLGAAGGLVVATYLLQILALAGLGTLIGLVIGALVPLVLIETLGHLLPVPIALGVYPLALAEAAALGLLTALAFSLWPVARAREVAAADLFRQSVATGTGRPRRFYQVATAAAALALAALAIVTAVDPRFGAIFVVGAVAVLLILRAGALGVAGAARRLPRAGPADVRIALDSLKRPAAPTATVVTSLGAGLTVLVAIALIEVNLRTQIGERLPEQVPAFFFIDIQDDQVEPFDAAVTGIAGTQGLKRVPVLRGRITALGGVPVERAPVAPEAAWAVQGDRAITYAAALPADAVITAGQWWPADYAGPPLVSLDANLARGFGLGVGDRLTVNILGRDIEAEIASLRRIEWSAVPFDFAIIFAPGSLEGAPHTHVAAVYAPPAAEPALERAITDRFTNVTAIRTRDAIEAVNAMIERIGWGVRTAALVTILAGALVLAGAIAADRRRRDYEAVLFKVLGATRRRIAAIYAVEYGLLGLLTGLIAAILGTAVAWAVTRYLMRLDWTLAPGVIVATVGIGVVLTLGLGFAGTWRRLGRGTAQFLRNE